MARRCLALGALLCLAVLPAARAAGPGRLTLAPADREPPDGRKQLAPAELAALATAVDENPRDRERRFALVRGLMASGDLPGALAAAKAWREVDAYNLVVVRMLGDIYMELGEKELARRTYSAVVELLPRDAQAHRALATVLKQAGDLDGAYERLAAAAALRPEDARIAFELADVAQRAGRTVEAQQRLEAVVAGVDTPESVRYPAKQRLAQVYAAQRRDALARGDQADAERLAGAIAALDVKGGLENDIKIYLTWDTDRSDVDLWVTNPAGEKVFYSHKAGRFGEALFDDVTNGYGPESFTAPTAQAGEYLVQVNYYGSNRSSVAEARGEVVVILHEGTADEERHVLPYRMFATGQVVTVARIQVR